MGSGNLGGCHACIKYLMFAFNFIFWLIGCTLTGFGIWVLVDDGFSKLAADSSFAALEYAGIVLCVVGGIIMVIGFFGCCGAIRESQCLLVMFFICMIILFLMLVGGGTVGLIMKDEFIEKAQDKFAEMVQEYSQDKPNQLVDLIQKQFECCGSSGPADYDGILGLIGFRPESCPKSILPPGCVPVMKDKLGELSIILAGIAIGAGVMMLLGMIFSMMLCCAIRDNE